MASANVLLAQDVTVVAIDLLPSFIKRLTDYLDGFWPKCGIFYQCSGIHRVSPVRSLSRTTQIDAWCVNS
jgi:hypothetical protein